MTVPITTGKNSRRAIHGKSLLDAVRVTPFQRRVYEALLHIPSGRVTTYGLLAAHLRCGSAQAVGQALRRNPLAPRVPCHRVIATDLSIGGFAGKRRGPEIRHKQRLLAKEGVHLTRAGKLAQPDRLFTYR